MAKLYDKKNYEYSCKKCGDSSTLRRLVDDRDDPVDCDKCGVQMVRKFSLGAFFI